MISLNESKIECLSLNKLRHTTTTKNSASNGKNRQINYVEILSACVDNGDSELLSVETKVLKQARNSASWQTPLSSSKTMRRARRTTKHLHRGQLTIAHLSTGSPRHESTTSLTMTTPPEPLPARPEQYMETTRKAMSSLPGSSSAKAHERMARKSSAITTNARETTPAMPTSSTPEKRM